MKRLLTLLIILIPTISTCQIVPVNFKDCHIDEMFVSADSEPKWNSDSIGMIDFMNKLIVEANLKTIKEGKIILGILIYPDGKTCCHFFINLTNTKLNAETFKEVVNKMPNWLPGKQSNRAITFLKHQIFYIKNGKFIQN